MEWLQIEPLLSLAAEQLARYSNPADNKASDGKH
jgi:hypothetical protein